MKDNKMTIGYWETFPVIGHDRWQKLPLEVEITTEIDFLNATDEEIEKFMLKVRRVQYALKKQVQSFFYESNKAAEKEKVIVDICDAPNGVCVKPKSVEERTVDQINEITDPKILKEFALLANNMASRYPKVKEAYDNRLKQLTI